MRLRRENFIRQCVLGSGTKTHAGANAGVTRTEAKNIAPNDRSGQSSYNFHLTQTFLKGLEGVWGNLS